jgi:site-specific recombinase XerC
VAQSDESPELGCEAIEGINLKRVNGRWLWRFEGEELKIGMRSGEPNLFEAEVPSEVVPYLEEYLNTWRPKLPNADRDRHVFLSKTGRPFTDTVLRNRLRINVYRYTKKHLFTHLLRTIFTRNHLTAGVDINSVAYGLGDTPAMVLRAYNELQAERHRPILEEANRRALENGRGTSL